MAQAIGIRSDFNERAEFLDANDTPAVDFSNLDFGRNRLNEVAGFFG
jgi:hypothetical protein